VPEEAIQFNWGAAERREELFKTCTACEISLFGATGLPTLLECYKQLVFFLFTR